MIEQSHLLAVSCASLSRHGEAILRMDGGVGWGEGASLMHRTSGKPPHPARLIAVAAHRVRVLRACLSPRGEAFLVGKTGGVVR